MSISVVGVAVPRLDGERLRQERIAARMTVTALAEAAGFTVQYVRMIESGVRRPAQMDTIRRLEDALSARTGRPVDLLAREDPDPT